MAIYCFTTDDGATAERQFPMGKAPKSILIDGHHAFRDFQAENSPKVAGRGWPMEPCVASGVNAAQAGELRKFFKDQGVPTDVTTDGDPVYTSPGHRKQALKLRGIHDKSGYY